MSKIYWTFRILHDEILIFLDFLRVKLKSLDI